MKTLLTFVGFHDPFSYGLVEGNDQKGPILSLMSAKDFDRAYLFSTPNTIKQTNETRNEIRELKLCADVETIHLELNDPTNYIEILSSLRNAFLEISSFNENASYYIAVASGTPQMHACWLLLVSSGEIPATVLHIRPPRFTSARTPLVGEIDLSSDSFPSVIFKQTPPTQQEQSSNPEVVYTQLGIIAEHPIMKKVMDAASLLATSSVPIMITGETGVGKELMAKFIHGMSGRPKEKYVAVNCAAIPHELVESILFGHKKGSFTGAVNDQKGKFDSADGGTLFLDELAELPLPTQAKLLRVLQEGSIESIGESVSRKIDVRIIAATNNDLKERIRRGLFRSDLFFRLAVGEIVIPPLRERRSDISKIALNHLDRVNRSLKKPKKLSAAALIKLQNMDWEGNIRDLTNVVERSALLCRNEVIDSHDLVLTTLILEENQYTHLPELQEGFSIENYMSDLRKQLIKNALIKANGNQSGAARLLGITPQAIHKHLQSAKSSTEVETQSTVVEKE